MTRVGAAGSCAWILAWALAASGCGGGGAPPGTRAEPPRRLPVRVLADTGSGAPFVVRPPRAFVSLARVSRAGGEALAPPLPPAAPDTSPPAAGSEPLATDEVLHAPIPKQAGTLVVPRSLRSPGTVELDVLVDVLGRVVDVRWVGGSSDPALVRAAGRCAESMTFYPALLRGQPVAVWCRQRFEVTPR